MKIIEVDEELYQYIASHTQSIGESASDILRRLLNLSCSTLSSSALSSVESKTVLNNTEKNKNTLQRQPSSLQSAVQKSIDFSDETDIEQSRNLEFISALLVSDSFKQENKGVSRFLSILTALYQMNPNAFSAAICSENVQGRTRKYFAKDQQTLLAVGNHTKPKLIPQTPYWVITNNNSGRKMIMLEAVMREMGLADDLIKQVKSIFIGN